MGGGRRRSRRGGWEAGGGGGLGGVRGVPNFLRATISENIYGGFVLEKI
jgi:hypothetical protein